MKVHFSIITPDNWLIFNVLKVREDQGSFVASNLTILARAFAFRDYNSQVFAIYYGDLPIGLLMQRDYKENNKGFCVLDQFMIAEQYQGKGFGKTAMKLWLSMIKAEEKYDSIILCYKDGDEIARNLYLGMGFHHTGEVDEDEIIMEYNLKEVRK
ncbi:GNAT family N-acetyltransferase [Desnuesiella massiliensis]|uniref:GNAT family N-acetyltransferase n=1 Tax=Desnuesiella massiliensis TaxID=1650662 RepID=UPI0006E39769|nr:GNAT family protein [Desnuesiella massiliensis]